VKAKTKPESTHIQVSRNTKAHLDKLRGRGQTYNGILLDLAYLFHSKMYGASILDILDDKAHGVKPTSGFTHIRVPSETRRYVNETRMPGESFETCIRRLIIIAYKNWDDFVKIRSTQSS